MLGAAGTGIRMALKPRAPSTEDATIARFWGRPGCDKTARPLSDH